MTPAGTAIGAERCHRRRNNEPPPVHGTGKQSRDFVYVENVAEANILAATTPKIHHEVINIGSGKDYSVLDTANILNKITQKGINPIFEPSRPGDVSRTLGDISKAIKILKFKPTIDFEKGLRSTIEWFQNKR